ncbi:glycosyltransferase [Virgibacillus sp. NKC19-16]|uniref:glycosyltransferase n=1 Tax=Virgibacillus salidurans TaxID=2831673 RepID=UPI001F329575|nr:glycosyltransferase [Virgibacillus sp. NKC19-16]UJL45915.1 glycosyltransferase [Virgibacillus sp. NKC19-16]
MEKKSVLFFIYQMGAGGAARTLLNIINNLDRTKFTPILVTLNYNGSYEEYIKSDVTFIKLETKRLRSAIFPLAKVIREEKADIVFSTIPNYNTIAILANLFAFTGAKNIVREAAFLGGSPKENIKLLAYGMLYKLSSKVIALSEGVKENIIKQYKVKSEKIKVIYNPVDLDSIENNIKHGQVAGAHQAIFNANEKIIITAGRLVKDKDHETLLRAFAKVNERIHAKLVILGEGELEEDLKRTAHEHHVQDKVHFIGFQQNPYIYFKQADVFVLSSKREGFGHVLAEALATGTPVVSTNAKPGAREVLNYGEFGRMCEVGNAEEMADKIYEILTLNKEQTAQIIDKGLTRANEFNAKKIVKQYEETFNQTIDQIEK